MSCLKDGHALVAGWLAGKFGWFCCNPNCDYFKES